MTDTELEAFLGIAGHPMASKVIATTTPALRALYDNMANLETELKLWQDGLGPKPKGVIICGRRGRHSHGRGR